MHSTMIPIVKVRSSVPSGCHSFAVRSTEPVRKRPSGSAFTDQINLVCAAMVRTHAPSTYKIPTASDRPASMNIKIWDKGRNQERTIHRSKAVGEPPFMLAISVFSALTHAVSGATGHRVFPQLDAPATPERILMAVDAARAEAEKLA